MILHFTMTCDHIPGASKISKAWAEHGEANGKIPLVFSSLWINPKTSIQQRHKPIFNLSLNLREPRRAAGQVAVQRFKCKPKRWTAPARMHSYPPENAAALSFGFQICLLPTAELLGIIGLIHSVLNQ